MTVQFDREKFKSVVHYVCASCEPSSLGAVKLNKVLYYADMLHFAFQGSPITGSPYRKRPHGPTSDYILRALRELHDSGVIQVEVVDYFGYPKKQYISLRAPDVSRLSKDEQEFLDEVIDFVCRNNTAKTISDLSHTRAWERAEFGDELPYHTAFYLLPTEVSEEAKDWASREVAALEGKGQKIESLVRRSLGDFRARLQQMRGQLS